MPLVRKMYREGKVWVEVDAQGDLLSERGLAKIRYREDDERTYSVRAEQIEEIDESRLKPRQPAEAQPSTLVIHTDGACFGNPGPAGVGVVLTWRDQHKEISRYLGEGTNNIAELTAILEGLKSVKNRRLRVLLYTDSSYCPGVLTGGWKVSKNRDLIAETLALISQFSDLELRKVKGHSGDPGNERADQLARDAVNREQSQGEG
jgi:ribonuclease HI